MRRPEPSVDDSLTRYVLDHYPHLMTESEAEIVAALRLNLKALQNPNRYASSKLADARGLAEKPHVQAALDAGYNESRLKICTRLLADHADQIVLNRCPNCDALCRTPTSQMCAGCGHSWHSQESGEQ